ncbi:hypothetical protein EHW64_08225 [Erwinia psidii]|uniref:AvrE-family type 3 secretion system effector n=1 Tax=Erwinia psidii TaxID=69224 RepID=UPI00226B9DC7|nr:AvrE-family type 3 secretion system effector [Erwinia psidii]MCX8961141.1 hypothetical protein [Erwinia psidii]
MAIEGARSIDPGIESVYRTVPGVFGNRIKEVKNKTDLFEHNNNRLMSHTTPLVKLASDALKTDSRLTISEALQRLAKEIKPKEAVHLTTSNSVSAFFGVALGGTPFIPGWFAGIVTNLSDRYGLTLSKTDEDHIRLSFNNQNQRALTGIAGTGQGLEKTLLDANSVNYMTVMPAEANAIMVVQNLCGNNFSFNLTQEDFDKFVTQLACEEIAPELQKQIISEAESEKITENGFILKIEAKSELRLQAGKMVNDNTFMVMPRTAVGASLALDFLKVQNSSHQKAKKMKMIIQYLLIS